MKVAFITGITGQDGSYLAELLLDKGYFVWGLIRRASNINTQRINHLFENKKLQLRYGDLTDGCNLLKIVHEIKDFVKNPYERNIDTEEKTMIDPDDENRIEIYNLGAMSHVKVSFDMPEYTSNADGLGTLRLLEVIRAVGIEDITRFYQAGTSELYGKVVETPQTETTPFYPRSPYGVAKLYGYWITKNYREAYGMYCCNGILFNHESLRRGPTFVTRKITRGLGMILRGEREHLVMGNLDSIRDWGHAKDYCIDLDTKILTINGYKLRNELNINDKIINYNLKENKWENDIIDDIYDIEYKGNMYLFEGNGFNFRCSENHIIYYQRKTIKSKNWGNLKKNTAKELFEQYENIKLRARYNYRYPGFIGGYKSDNDDYISNEMLTLIGYILTEGNLFKSKKIGGGLLLSVSQSKKKYFNELKAVIDNIGLKYNLREREDLVCEFKFNAESRDVILDYFDSFDIHILPKKFYNLSSEKAKILFNSMMNADGCWSSLQYISSRFKLADDFSHIANLAGYRTKINKRKSGEYCVQIFSHAKKSVFQYVTNIKKEYTEENIWCVKTKNNGTIITKKPYMNGIFISGNCNGMYLMLQQDEPDDYVLATNETHTVREFVEKTFALKGFEIKWKGEGVDEIGYDKKSGRELIFIDEKYFRPTEVDLLHGDPTKAEQKLEWKRSYSFDMLVREMVEHDC